jgi:hypothetical protein
MKGVTNSPLPQIRNENYKERNVVCRHLIVKERVPEAAEASS